MKSRPRRAENRIADTLSGFFISYGLSVVERIPVLGRTGPDLTINETGLVIDVKSRQTCPITTFRAVERTGKARNDSHAAFQLDQLDSLLDDSQYTELRFSKMVDSWLKHMDEWTQAESSWGISALVLHKPNMPYGKAVLVINSSDVGYLKSRILNPDIIGNGNVFIRMIENWILVHTQTGEEAIQLSYDDLSTLQTWIDRSIT